MSLIDEILSKTKKSASSGEVSPVLEQIVTKRSSSPFFRHRRGSLFHRRIGLYLISGFIAFSVITGVIITKDLIPELSLSPPREQGRPSSHSGTVTSGVPPTVTSPQKEVSSPSGITGSEDTAPATSPPTVGGTQGETLFPPVRPLTVTSPPIVTKAENKEEKTGSLRKEGSKKGLPLTSPPRKVDEQKPELLLRSQRPSLSEKDSTGLSGELTVKGPEKGIIAKRDLLYRANTHELKGEYREAIRYYEEALKIEPTDIRIMNQIAYLYIKTGIPEKAMEYCERVLSLKKDYIPSMINLSVALMMKGDRERAEGLLKEILLKEPHNRTALYNLALLYEEAGRFENALESYKKLLSLGDKRGGEGMRRIGLKDPYIKGNEAQKE